MEELIIRHAMMRWQTTHSIIVHSFGCFSQEDVDHENLILNHMTNVAIFSRHLANQKLGSLVTGGPPLWVTHHRHNR